MNPIEQIRLPVNGDASFKAHELEKSMFLMEQSIQQTLRNVDVMTRYGKNQFFIILLGTDPEGAKKAAERIFEDYYKLNSDSVYTPSYFIAEMEESAG